MSSRPPEYLSAELEHATREQLVAELARRNKIAVVIQLDHNDGLEFDCLGNGVSVAIRDIQAIGLMEQVKHLLLQDTGFEPRGSDDVVEPEET